MAINWFGQSALIEKQVDQEKAPLFSRRPFVVSCLATATLLLTAVASCIAQAPPAASNALDDLDTLFVPAYEARTAALNATNPPYIEVSGSSLFLHLRGQAPVKIRVLTDTYHRLKDVAHAPFTVYLTLVGVGNGTLSDTQLDQIRQLSAKLAAAKNGLSSAGFDPGQEKRQQEILDASIRLVDQASTNKTVNQSALKMFARTMGSLMLENANEAGCFQVLATHKQMMLWKPLMTEQEWQDLHVVIKNLHQARYRNVATQYFAWLLGGTSPGWELPGENDRVVYAESLFGTQTGGDELLTVLVDFDASRSFFGNEWRLTEDILSNGAARCVAQLSPADRTWNPVAGGAK